MLEADIDTKVCKARSHTGELCFVSGVLDDLAGQESIESVADARRRNDAPALDSMAVSHFNTCDDALFHQDLFNTRVGKNFPACFLNFGNNMLGNLPASARRIKPTIQIVASYHRVHHERRLFRRQTHIPPLAAQGCDKIRIVGEFAQHIMGLAIQQTWFFPFQDRCREHALPGL